MVYKGKKLSPTERFVRIQRQHKHFGRLKLALLLLFFFGASLLVYQVWLRDFLFPASHLGGRVTAPSAREVQEKRMIRPAFFGYNKRQEPFKVEAEMAHELDGAHIHLKNPKSTIFGAAGTTIEIHAKEGVMEKSSQAMDLQGAVTLKKEGVTFVTNSLHYDTKKQEGFGNDPVEGLAKDKKITAGAFQIKNNGATVHFYKDRPQLTLQAPRPRDVVAGAGTQAQEVKDVF